MCVLVPLPMCAHAYSLFFPTHRTRGTHLRSPSTKELRTRLSPLLKHLPYQTPEIYTPLPPHRAPKHRDTNMRADVFLISPFEAITVVWRGLHCAPVFSFPRFDFRGCGCEQRSFPFLGHCRDSPAREITVTIRSF